ncbi:MAG: hypothetical protein ACE5FU_05020 [Nitrospinota bacterium]
MKKIFAGLILGVFLIFSHAGVSKADTLYVPWYNETASFNTWLLFSNTASAIAATDLTIIALNTAGNAIGSTNPTIAASNSWAFALGSAINATTVSGNSRGQLTITGTDAILNTLNIFIVVQGTGTTDAGFVVPVYANGVTTSNKYAPQ